MSEPRGQGFLWKDGGRGSVGNVAALMKGTRIADISKTSVCPLARVMRRELKKRNVEHVKVVYSKEKALTPLGLDEKEEIDSKRRATPGSTAFVPSAAGLVLAAEVIRDLIKKNP